MVTVLESWEVDGMSGQKSWDVSCRKSCFSRVTKDRGLLYIAAILDRAQTSACGNALKILRFDFVCSVSVTSVSVTWPLVIDGTFWDWNQRSV